MSVKSWRPSYMVLGVFGIFGACLTCNLLFHGLSATNLNMEFRALLCNWASHVGRGFKFLYSVWPNRE